MKKYLKYIAIIFLLGFLVEYIVSGGIPTLSKDIKELNLVGRTYSPPLSIEMIDVFGTPQTLVGTDSLIWTAYFPKGNFTLVVNKRTQTIISITAGKKI